MQKRLCNKCKIEKSSDQFTPKKDRASGYASSCKNCLSKYMQAKRSKIIRIPKITCRKKRLRKILKEKTCSRCHVIKKIGEFTGVSKQTSYCKPCHSQYVQEWRNKHPRIKKIKPRKPIPPSILFDEADRALIEGYTWGITQGYATSFTIIDGKQKTIRMHRIVLGDIPEGMQPDHINRNRSDNRRENLRIVPITHNRQNRPGVGLSGYRGVSWNKRYARWQVQIQIDKVPYHLGYYRDKIFAAAIASTYRAIYMPGATD